MNCADGSPLTVAAISSRNRLVSTFATHSMAFEATALAFFLVAMARIIAIESMSFSPVRHTALVCGQFRGLG